MRRQPRQWFVTVIAAAAAAALGTAGSLAILSPAGAASCAKPMGYAATANADLLKLGLVDLRPLGLPLPKLADITIGSSRASMSATSPVSSAGAATYADAKLLGIKLPTGPLDAAVYQQAPPSHQDAVRNNALSLELGVAKAGTGDLTAHAQWASGMSCGTRAGTAGTATAALVDLALLPGSGGPLLKAPRNLSSRTATGLILRDGRLAAAAGAEVGLAGLTLLGGKLTVKVIEPPQLKVFATGKAATSSVEYSSPILEISGTGVPTQRLSGLSESIEVAVPSGVNGLLSPLTEAAARKRAEAEGLPLLPGNALADLLGGLPLNQLTQLTQQLGAGVESGGSQLPAVPELGNLPVLGNLLGGAMGGNLTGSLGEIAVLRISIGELKSHVSDKGVRAQAASLRIQLLALGKSGGEKATVVDLGIGLVEASATAPKARAVRPSTTPSARASSSPSPTVVPGKDGEPVPVGQEDECGDASCDGGGLPLTGTSIGIIVGAGTVLFVGGRLLQLLAARRRGDGPLGMA